MLLATQSLGARICVPKFGGSKLHSKVLGIAIAFCFSVALPAEPRGEKKTFFCANFGR